MPQVKEKGIQRIVTSKGKGWQVRVAWQTKLYTKWFSDSVWKGKQKAFKAAVEYRNELEQNLGKPRSNQPYRPVLPPRSKTGYSGIYLIPDRGVPSFEIVYKPEPGVIKKTRVSIRKHGKEKALELALQIQRERSAPELLPAQPTSPPPTGKAKGKAKAKEAPPVILPVVTPPPKTTRTRKSSPKTAS